jgi:hypothetical protein
MGKKPQWKTYNFPFIISYIIMNHISNALTSAETYKNIATKNIKEYIEYFAIGTFIVIFLVIIYSISTSDPSGLINKHFNVFIFFSSISLFYLIINLLALALKKGQTADKKPIITIKHINVTLAVISILYIIFKLRLFHLNITSIMVNILLVACAVTILKLSQISSVNFSEIQKWIKYEYNQLPNHTVYIFAVMFVVVVLSLSVNIFDPLIRLAILPKFKQLVTTPIYTNSLNNYESFQYDSSFKYQYAISSWIYINPQPPNTSPAYNKYSSLLNYGSKPNIMYKGRDNDLMIQMLKGEDKQIKTFHTKDVLLQKWNHIVINYTNNNLDVFLNNKLVGSEVNITPFMKHDMISTGENTGIHGGIKNTYYFNKPLYLWQINYLYSQK